MIHHIELELIAERYLEERRQAAVERQLRKAATSATARPGLLARLHTLLSATSSTSDDRAGTHGIQRVLAS
jgi:hypothetical protein